MTRRKHLLFMLFVVVAAVLLQGICVTYADTGAAGERQLHPNAIRDPNVDQNLSPKARARAQRSAAIKKRQATKKFIKDVMEGKPAASDNSGKGVAK